MSASKAWIITFTGKQFYHLSPRQSMVCIEDIAHSLSQQCRWTGHSRFHYSVAQHSYYCSLIVSPQDALHALLHDGSEAYMGDMNRPLKHFTPAGVSYRVLEAKLQSIIFKKFGLSSIEPEAVRVADDQMLYAEKSQIINVPQLMKYERNKWGRGEAEANIQIEEWTPKFAELMFLKRFAELYKEK